MMTLFRKDLATGEETRVGVWSSISLQTARQFVYGAARGEAQGRNDVKELETYFGPSDKKPGQREHAVRLLREDGKPLVEYRDEWTDGD